VNTPISAMTSVFFKTVLLSQLMFRYFFSTVFLLNAFAIPAFSQKKVFEDDFKNNKHGWRLQHDSNFLVDINNGVLHIEKFEKNFTSRGCLWYTKAIPGFNTLHDFSITLYARFISGGDIFDMMDFQWGEGGKTINGKLSANLYQLSFLLKGEVKLDYFHKNWTYFVRKNINALLGSLFDPKRINKYGLVQKDSFLIFSINDKEVLRQYGNPVAGNSIGFQQCLKSAWEIDKIVIRQSEKNSIMRDSTRIPSEVNAPSGKELKVYPNPFDHHLGVDIYLEQEQSVQLSLIDMNGIILQQHTRQLSAGLQRIQLYADVAPGSYLLKVQMGKKVVTATLIKQ
jgi:hypothetical protein